MNRIAKIVFPLLLIASLLAACSAPSEQQSVSNAVMQTMVALNVQNSQTAVAQSAIDQATSTANALIPTLTVTPTVFSSPTAAEVWLVVNENTNCRKGPGANYDYVALLEKGTRVQSLARNYDNDFYYVSVPGQDNVKCWVWSKYLTVEGDATPLPIYTALPSPTPSPTPTPVPSFNASYMDMDACAGYWTVRIHIYNSGGVKWESVHMKIKDTVTGDIMNFSSDTFTATNGCVESSSVESLKPGEEGFVSNYKGKFKSNPSGHKIEVTITLYTKDGETGSSYSQSLRFTP
jgi:hypothetical protein